MVCFAYTSHPLLLGSKKICLTTLLEMRFSTKIMASTTDRVVVNVISSSVSVISSSVCVISLSVCVISSNVY